MKEHSATLESLLAIRSELKAEIEAMQNKLAGLEMAIAYINPAEAEPSDGEPKISVKKTLMELLGEAGAKGLNSRIAIQKAQRRGIPLVRGSVSSMFSRLKREGLVTYDGERYRLNGHALDA